MNFFDLSDGKSATETDGSFDTNPDIKPIPENTLVEAIAEVVKWDTSDHFNGKFVSIRWSVLKPAEFENRKVFQKVKVFDDSAKVSDKAKRMLAAIDNNAGGKLMALGKEPTDEDLARCLENRMMMLKLGIWQVKDDVTGDVTNEGNWVKAVSPRNAPGSTPAAKPKPKADDFDDIAF